MKTIILLKLGGSIITDKEKPNTPNQDRITSFARQIHSAIKSNPDLRLIIGHGSGSFAHVPAKKYRITEGITSDSQIMGMCEVADAAARLNRIVVEILLQEGIRAQSFSPSSWVTTRNGARQSVHTEPVFASSGIGIVPVVYGDMIVDSVKKGVIYSTEMVFDALISQAAELNQHISSIVQVGRTDGLLDRSGKIVPVISEANIDEVKRLIGETKGYDVTGGMLHKIEESLKIAKLGIPTTLIGGNDDHTLLDVLMHIKVIGTRIL